MAARLNPVARDEIVDLRLVAAADLDPVLEEEVAVWHDDLEWDFAKSAQLARRFVGVHALSGRVLVVDGRVAGCHGGRLLLYSVPSGVTELLVRGIEAGHQQRLLMLPPGLARFSMARFAHAGRAAPKRQGRWGRKSPARVFPQPPPGG